MSQSSQDSSVPEVYPRPPNHELTANCPNCGGFLKQEFLLCKGTTNIMNMGRWYQRCTVCFHAKYHSHARLPEAAIPEYARAKEARKQSAKETGSRIPCGADDCRYTSTNQPKFANANCDRDPPLCSTHCYALGGCQTAHKIRATPSAAKPQAVHVSPAPPSVSQPPSSTQGVRPLYSPQPHTFPPVHSITQPLVVSAAGPSSKQAPALRKFGRALKEGYGYKNRTAQAARVKEQANAISKLLDEHLSKVSIVFWFKDACPESPIRIEVQPNPPGKCVLQDVRYFMRLINQYSISDVAFYNVNCPDPHWVVQDVGFAIDVKPPQQLLVRNVDLREDQCPGLREKMALITEGAEISRQLQPRGHPRKKARTSSPQFIRVFTQGPRAPGSTEPPSTDPDSDFLPIHERHVCDVHDGLLEIIQSKLSVEKAYRTAFPDLSYTSTVPRYLTIFKKAHELSLVPRFVGYGKSEWGTWKALKEAIGQAQEIQSNSEVVFLQVITPQLQACKENSAENHEEPATSKFYMVKQPVAIGEHRAIYSLWNFDFTPSNLVIKKLQLPQSWTLEDCPVEYAVTLDVQRILLCERYARQFADKIQAQGIIDACDFQFMKTKLAYAVPDLSGKNKHCYLWAAVAQEEASGVRFSTLKASTGGQRSQHLRDWSTDAADTLDAFAHYVYQASLGTTSVRNFQGFIAQEADTKLLIFDCDIHRE
ncbi:hypothetical protein CPC08DRAFT_771341 [Agrocybe pediades]|nr:hypothetical protein CPC08DRAFT_771341 [Agrocybe pediades]